MTNLINPYVDTTSSQNIGGAKTFSSNVTFSGSPAEVFITDGSVAAHLLNDGNLHIDGNGQNVWLDGGNLYLQAQGGMGSRVGIGNSSPGAALDVTGTGNFSSDLSIGGLPRFNGTNTTGAGAALLGTNSPATTNTAPYTWIKATAADGSTVYIPAWK